MSKLYIAYGSNLNRAQMAKRCPKAKIEGVSVIKNYELVFRGGANNAVATIEPKEGCSVPVALWSIEKTDEKNLDIYEGFPCLYTKEKFTLEINGKAAEAMAYIMTSGKEYGNPSQMYLDTISRGYADFGFDLSILHKSVELNANRITCPGSSTIIFKWSEKQEKQFISACPRCGIRSMSKPMHRNALSRRADIYICDECGMEEAVKDMLGKSDTIDEWHAVREYFK